MPTVPQYNAPQVQEQAAPNVQVPTNAPIEDFGGGQAAQSVFDTAEKISNSVEQIALQQKHQADEIAVTDADTKAGQLKNSLFYDPSNGAFLQKGKDAFAAVGNYSNKFNQGLQDIQSTLNPTQQAMFQSKALVQKADLNNQLQRHAFTEGQAYDQQVTDASVSNYANQAVLNYQNPGAVQAAVDQQTAVMTQHAQRNGIPPEVLQENLAATVSKTNALVVNRMLDNGDTDQAQSFYDTNKDKFTGTDASTIEKSLKASQVLDTSMDTWDEVKGYQLPDGKPDEARMQAHIMADTDNSPEENLKIWEYTKARSAEQFANITKQKDANEHDFLNTVAGLKQDGQPLDVALRQVNDYADDDLDAQTKEAAARKMYAPKEASDPKAYINLWQGIQDGTATKQQLDKAMMNDDINASDWRSLSQDLYKTDVEGKSPQMKQAWDKVHIIAETNYSDIKDRQNFIYDLHQSAQGKTPDQILQMSQDKLKNDPSSGYFSFTQNKAWETDLKQKDNTNIAWGKLDTDIGKDQATAFKSGVQFSQGRSATPSDIDAFASQFGGYKNIKAGTPANNAIQSLMKMDTPLPVTPANVKALLEKFPDGVMR